MWSPPVIHPEMVIAMRRKVQEIWTQHFEGRPYTRQMPENFQYMMDRLNEVQPWSGRGWEVRAYVPDYHDTANGRGPRVTLHNVEAPMGMPIQIWPALPEHQLVELLGKPL